MSTALSSPVTGSAQPALTSPTYTLTSDLAPTPNGRQYAVTALGGTQTGVVVHNPTVPFTITIVRPAQFKSLGAPNYVTGVPTVYPRNVWKVIVRKGAKVSTAVTVPQQIAMASLEISIPAGTESTDAVSIEAMMSLLIGSMNQISSSLSTSLETGVA